MNDDVLAEHRAHGRADECWCDCFKGSAYACSQHKAALVAEVKRAREALQAAERKVRAVELLHVWTNENGKRFVFADDLAVALEIPGAGLDAALDGAS